MKLLFDHHPPVSRGQREHEQGERDVDPHRPVLLGRDHEDAAAVVQLPPIKRSFILESQRRNA